MDLEVTIGAFLDLYSLGETGFYSNATNAPPAGSKPQIEAIGYERLMSYNLSRPRPNLISRPGSSSPRE
jgi:hypothetical protein